MVYWLPNMKLVQIMKYSGNILPISGHFYSVHFFLSQMLWMTLEVYLAINAKPPANMAKLFEVFQYF